ncbi:MAG: GTP 3',8-cyclase MoaA [Elusimicrobiota bacterium]
MDLIDSYGRRLDYLRLSVTGLCNMKCRYCLVDDARAAREPATDDELLSLVRLLAGLGVGKVRVTGGEPLLRPGLDALIRGLSRIKGVRDLSLTTNGLLLASRARELKAAGLSRVNISLDTLRRDRFRSITGGPGLSRVLAGIEASLKAGLDPVKLNIVVMAKVNSDEIPDFVGFTRKLPVHVRFIELMPIGPASAFNQSRWVPLGTMQEKCRPLATLPPRLRPKGSGPAVCFKSPGSMGTIGFISPLSEKFCGRCNRLRLTSGGTLLPCLAEQTGGEDLLGLLRSGAKPQDMAAAVLRAVKHKAPCHRMCAGRSGLQTASMCSVGG